MRHAIAIVFAALLAIGPVSAQSQQRAPAAPSAESLAAARELMVLIKATDQFKILLPSILAALKPAIVQNRPQAEQDFDAVMPIVTAAAMRRLNDFAELMATVYARNFSVDEIHDLIAFYRTPTGQKLIARQPVVAQQGLAAGQEFGRQLVVDLRQDIMDEMRKREDPSAGQH
jgi:hypothetical protein